jgi:hypothetical protein
MVGFEFHERREDFYAAQFDAVAFDEVKQVDKLRVCRQLCLEILKRLGGAGESASWRGIRRIPEFKGLRI